MSPPVPGAPVVHEMVRIRAEKRQPEKAFFVRSCGPPCADRS
jgi:hypothetical protein